MVGAAVDGGGGSGRGLYVGRGSGRLRGFLAGGGGAGVPVCMAAGFLAGCGDFWQAPGGSSTSFTLTNSGAITVSPGATTGNTATITVTPSNSFTGTVTLRSEERRVGKECTSR